MKIRNIEITPRETVVAIILVIIFATLGVLLFKTIRLSELANAAKYASANSMEGKTEFIEGAKNNAGLTLATSTITTPKPVVTPYAKGQYMALRIEEQRWEESSTTINNVVVDTSGFQTAHTEYLRAKDFEFLGLHASTQLLPISENQVATHVDPHNSHHRWVVYGAPTDIQVTMFVDLKDGKMQPVDNQSQYEVYPNMTPSDVRAAKQTQAKTWPVVLLVVSLLLTVVGAVLFVVIENDWLENLNLPFIGRSAYSSLPKH
ncbi:hypothetical protein FWF48_03685 [Candidatus Saccharibacteria bacterium]|nr:hypothetical protein [Candidatus Saccharibacteria bacterium]